MTYSSSQLIDQAVALLKPHKTAEGRLFGDVAAVLVSETGRLYSGVCVDTASWGLCAERSAMAAMITAGEYRVKEIVAVWVNPNTQDLHVLPPCGHCRAFMHDIDHANLATSVILGPDRVKTLAELLPEHAWPKAIK